MYCRSLIHLGHIIDDHAHDAANILNRHNTGNGPMINVM